MNITKELALEALSNVMDPDLGKDLVTLGMIDKIEIEGNINLTSCNPAVFYLLSIHFFIW